MNSFNSTNGSADALAELTQGMHAALETYSNVHRGSGHFSQTTTDLYEEARATVLEYLGLEKGRFMVIFGSQARAEALKAKLKAGSYSQVSSADFGLCLGVTALAIKRNALPKGAPVQPGGGTARLFGPDWVIWAKDPDRFEAGTPSIINVITFAGALKMKVKNPGLSFQDQDRSLSAENILNPVSLEGYSGAGLHEKLRQTLIGRNTRVRTINGERPFINFDNAASTPAFEAIFETVCKTLRAAPEIRKELVEKVKSIAANFLGAPEDVFRVIFTCNTTEAINLAAEKLSLENFGDGCESVVLNTLAEHSSNDLPWRDQPTLSLVRLGVNNDGAVDHEELERILKAYNKEELHGKKRIRLVALSGASNVLAYYNDLSLISGIVHRYGARLLVDGAQMLAHRRIDQQGSGIDYLAFSAHKAYAPFGTGALVVRNDIPGFSPDETGKIRASGEENTAGIAALGTAMTLLHRVGFDRIREEEQELTKIALLGLSGIPGMELFGVKDPASPEFSRKGGVIIFQVKGTFPDRMGKRIANHGGIGLRYGCHCAHLIIKKLLKFTPTLEFIQRSIVTLIPGLTLPGLLRISFGLQNTREEVEFFVGLTKDIASKKIK
jgi:selenocysteine lyase/cysteine desulfurase